MSEYHVASFIAYTYPDEQPQVMARLAQLASCDIHGDDGKGRIIVTLESESQRGIVDGFEQITNVAGVLNLSPVYHEYCDETN
ncbi:MAG: hypothetical protein BM565_06550 [Gammaproteobacteria bacterium MedPE]|nr:MAG: hypothetical protein BM565_06550 [Gammaproteobacteria bacterium MedPE]